MFSLNFHAVALHYSHEVLAIFLLISSYKLYHKKAKQTVICQKQCAQLEKIVLFIQKHTVD